MSLITAYEVQKKGPADESYPASVICKHIDNSECLLFSSCWLGEEFYNLLESSKSSSVAVPYNIETTYGLNAVVVYEGCYLKSKIANNTIHPDNDTGEAWALNPKFTNESFNILWNKHMCSWLAFEIIYTSMKYNTFKMGAKGTTRLKDDETGLETVDYKTFQSVKTEIRHDADVRLKNMFDYIMMSKDDNFKILKQDSSCVDGCKPVRKRRRFYFGQE